MNGPHDMGGFTGFGPVVVEADEPVFHEAWEAKVFALLNAAASASGWPANRPFRESLPALKYWSASYYEIWFEAMLLVIAERGLDAVTGAPTAEAMAAMLHAGSPESLTAAHPQRFSLGTVIRTRVISTASHTRLPRFARGREGEIVGVHGTFAYPDSYVRGLGDDPQWLYSVRFSARELWGKDTRDFVYLDLWEPYLEEPHERAT